METWRSAFLLVTNDKNCFGASLFLLHVGESLHQILSLWLSYYLPYERAISLRQRPKRYRLSMKEIAVLMFFFCFFFVIRLQASRRTSQCGIDLCMTDGYILAVYYADVLFRNVTTENVSVTSKEYVGDNGSTLCIIVIQISFCFKAFQYIRICQWNTGFNPKHLLRWRSRLLETPLCWKFCIAKNVWIFHTPSTIHFTGRKNCWLNAAMSGGVVHYQYRHCISFHVTIWNVTSLHFWLGIICCVILRYHKFLKQE